MKRSLCIGILLVEVALARATVYRALTADNTTIFSDWSAAENGQFFSIVTSGAPSMPWITSTQHYSGSYALGIQVPTDNSGNKERFEYVILPASDTNGLHFDNSLYCGFAFKLASPAASFGSSALFWQAWQGSPWGPPASLKLTADSSAPYTIGLYIRNMATGPDSSVPDTKLWSSSMIQPEVWYTVVIYLAPRYTNNTGNIKLWVNGTNYVNLTTNIGYDPSQVSGALNGLDIKNGIYQPDANNGHTMFFDQILVADNFAQASSLPVFSNTAPVAGAGNANTKQNRALDFDLRTISSDAQTPIDKCVFMAGPATNGTVTLLGDGHTAHFVPASNFLGTASFKYFINDQGEDTRTYLHYDFESTNALSDTINDASGNFRNGTLVTAGSGVWSYSTNVPFPALTAGSLALTQSGSAGAACASWLVPPQFNLSDSSWTLGVWFQRVSTADHDFLFYIGTGNGFGGDGDELQFNCPIASSTVRLQHYNSTNALDADVASPSTAGAGQWHHAALVFQRTNTNSGLLRGYLDGFQFGATNVVWSLQQQLPIVFGGHNATNSALDRWFNGWLDDIVLFTNALSTAEILALASEPAAVFGGLRATNQVNVFVDAYAPPTVSTIRVTNGFCQMTIAGEPGPTYIVQATTNLPHPMWISLLTNSGAPPFNFAEAISNAPIRFYRVMLIP